MEESRTITPLEWAIERVRWQNPRIRALLGCVRGLESVLESNFAILHCSPARLLEIWDTVRTACWVVKNEITPLMEHTSMLPELDTAVSSARETLAFLSDEFFAQIDSYPDRPEEHHFDDLRKTLCITIGKLHGFLVNTLGEILAADPRSDHDVDYFLARKFPRDVEEAEWLQSSVRRLDNELLLLNARRPEDLDAVIDTMSKTERMPSPEIWQRVTDFLEALGSRFAPQLKTIAGLRAIRITELEVLQAHARDLPESCRVAGELHETARAVLETIVASTAAEDGQVANPVASDVERVLCSRILSCLRVIENELRDLATFIPLWLSNIEKRRALMLRPTEDGASDTDDQELP